MLKEYIEVDTHGNVVDVHLFHENDVIPPNHFLGWGQGFYSPIWDFELNTWVEGRNYEDILNEFKSAKLEELNARCEKEILGYFQAPVNKEMYEFSFDEKAQMNFTGALALFTKGLASEMEWTAWKDGVSSRIVLNEMQFLQVIGIAFNRKNSMISKFRNELQPLVENATTIEEVNSIVW